MNRMETDVPRTSFSLAECARSVGTAPQLIKSWLDRPTDPLPHIRAGKRIIIPVRGLEDWLEKQAAKTQPDS